MINTIINLPILLSFLALFGLERLYLNFPILLVTIVDETAFRYVYFKIVSKTTLFISLNGFLYGLYGYFWIRNSLSFTVYFFLGLIFSFASKRYSIFSLFLMRYVINLYCVI